MLRVRRGKLPLLAAAVAGAIPSFGFGQTSNWTFTGALGSWTGTWNVNTNWSPNTAFPNSPTAVANFNATVLLTGSGGSGTTVISNTTVSVKAINFQPVGTNSNSFSIVGGGTLGGAVNVANNGTINVDNGNGGSFNTATISATVTSPSTSTIYKTGSGILVLSGSNNFGGGSGANGLSVNGGTLIAVGANALAGLSIISTASTGVLELQNVTIGSIPSPVIGGVGSAFQPDQGMVHASGNNSWTGNWFSTAKATTGVDAASTLSVNGGLFDGTDTNTNGFSKVGGTGTMIVNQMVLNGPLTVSSGRLQIKAGATPDSAAGASSASAVNISGTGLLDVTNNKMKINYASAGNPSPAAAIRAALISGRNGSANWTGTTGITTSVGNNDRTLGYVDGSDGNGTAVPAGVVEIAYVIPGDLNMDGVVNLTDFAKLTSKFNQSVTAYDLGDIDYNGVVNLTDFAALTSHFGQNIGAALPGVAVTALDIQEVNDFAAAHGVAGVVPEPATFSVIGLAGLGVLSRRVRRGRQIK